MVKIECCTVGRKNNPGIHFEDYFSNTFFYLAAQSRKLEK